MPKNKKRSDGYYRYWYKGKQFLGKTDAEAKAKRDAYKYECEHGIEQQLPVRVFDLAEKWLPVSKASVARNTYNQYAGLMEKLTSVIGEKLVTAVTPADIKLVWTGFVGQSQSQIKKARFLYKSFFQYAIENGYARQNPLLSDSARPHTGTKGTHRPLEQWEIDLVESTPHRCQTAAMFMLHGGFRREEILPMTKDDIHEGRISVTKAVKFVSNRPVISETKNESSNRQVPLFDILKPFAEALHEGEYLLPDRNGKICSETAFRRAWESYLSDLSEAHNGCPKRWWHLTAEWKQSHPKEYITYLSMKNDPKKAEEAEAYRLRGWHEVSFRPHDLRHTFVTDCRDKGVDIHVCMKWCGHASERMILEIYDHVSDSRERSATALMDGTVEKQ